MNQYFSIKKKHPESLVLFRVGDFYETFGEDAIKSSKIFLTQLEVPKDVTLHCLKTAKENGCITILNPAPASEISKDFFNN